MHQKRHPFSIHNFYILARSIIIYTHLHKEVPTVQLDSNRIDTWCALFQSLLSYSNHPLCLSAIIHTFEVYILLCMYGSDLSLPPSSLSHVPRVVAVSPPS